MTKLGHRASLDLSDPFTGEVEVPPDVFERSGLSAVKTEAEPEDLPLPFVERCEKAPDLGRQERNRGGLEG